MEDVAVLVEAVSERAQVEQRYESYGVPDDQLQLNYLLGTEVNKLQLVNDVYGVDQQLGLVEETFIEFECFANILVGAFHDLFEWLLLGGIFGFFGAGGDSIGL